MAGDNQLASPSSTITSEEKWAQDRKNIETLVGYKKVFEPRWYIASAFYDGRHFTYGQRDASGAWVSMRQPKGKVMREIPKAKKQLQNMRNMILKLDRKPVIYPDMNVIGLMNAPISDMEEEHAKQQGRVVQYFWDEVLKVKRYYKKIVKNAELHAHCYAQILSHGNGRYEMEVIDAFEGSSRPDISTIKDSRKFVKHIAKTIEELMEDDSYDQAVLAEIKENMADGKYSSSTYKQDLMTQKYGKADPSNVLVDELYEIVLVPNADNAEKNPEADPTAPTPPNNPGDVKLEAKSDQSPETGETPEAETPSEQSGEQELVERVRIASYIKEKCIREQIIPLSRLPQAVYVWGDEAYETSIMEDMIPGNRSYDILVSKLEAKAKKLDTGRISIQKGEDTKILTTDDGEFVRWKRVKPEVMQESQLSNTFMEALNLLDGDLKELGISISSGSDIPPGVKAAQAIEALKESDYSTLGGQITNFDEFVVELTETLIEMIAYDTVDVQYARAPKAEGGYERIKYIGQRGADIYKKIGVNLPSDVVVISPNRTVKVEVEAGVSFTEAGKKDLVFQIATLLQAQATPLPPDVILDLLDVGDTEQIADKIKEFMTYGKTMVDMPDFKMLPLELQNAIAIFLANGAASGMNGPTETAPPTPAIPATPTQAPPSVPPNTPPPAANIPPALAQK